MQASSRFSSAPCSPQSSSPVSQMNGFEFLFSFYSLLLGLAVANVATGLADSWRFRARTALGAPTLLLGLLILLSAAQQWLSFWKARAVLTMGPWEVLVAMGMSLPYIFVSQAMLPREHEQCTDLRVYYARNSRSLMTARCNELPPRPPTCSGQP